MTTPSEPVRIVEGEVQLEGELPAGNEIIGATRDAGASWAQRRLFNTHADWSGSGYDLTGAPLVATNKIVIDDILLSSSATAAIVLTLEEETSGTDIFKVNIPAGGFPLAQATLRGQLKLDTVNKKLRAVASASGQIDVLVLYHEEP